MIKFITDSASDIPQHYEEELDIEILPIPITIGEHGYYERRDFNAEKFYDILETEERVPVTSHINMIQLGEKYRELYEAGYEEIVHVTISSMGSTMYESAKVAREMFYQGKDGLRKRVRIHIIDSKTYSYGYGMAVVQGAKMARNGKNIDEILNYMREYFERVEIYFSIFSLKFAKKSGRIGVVSTFMGEMLGYRPIILIKQGKMKMIEKIRGDKNVLQRLATIMREKMGENEKKCSVIEGKVGNMGEVLCEMIKKDKEKREIDRVKVGASIAINSGPRVLGVMFLGK